MKIWNFSPIMLLIKIQDTFESDYQMPGRTLSIPLFDDERIRQMTFIQDRHINIVTKPLYWTKVETKKLYLLVVILMISVSLSGCLGRGGGNADGDNSMGSPEDVNAEDYNVL